MMLRPTDEQDPADWLWMAEDRLAGADALHEARGITPLGIEALHEAAERYLKGFLIARGWRLEKIHDLAKLTLDAAGFDPRFQAFLHLGKKLTEGFFLGHYPGGDLTEFVDSYDAVRAELGELVALIRELLPEYFKP